jgi:ammonium transporter, Amt family
MIGSAAIVTATFSTTMVVMYAINAFGLLRVSEEGELAGLDIHEHGIPAYPEHSLYPSATPHGARVFNEGAYASIAVSAPLLKKA